MKICNLYKLTKQKPISETIERSQKVHLGNVLRRQTATRDNLECIVTAPPVKKPSKPTNIIKTYNKHLGTNEFGNWHTMVWPDDYNNQKLL